MASIRHTPLVLNLYIEKTMDRPRKVYLLTEEQMDSIMTRLSSMSRYVGPEESRTITKMLGELHMVEHIDQSERTDISLLKFIATMKGGAK